MAIRSWMQQMVHKGSGATGAKPQIGMQVRTEDDVLLGTIDRIWLGVDATDLARHPDTFGVRQADPDVAGLLYIPADLVDHVSAEGVVLRVDATQVTNRGCRFRPEWLAPDTVRSR